MKKILALVLAMMMVLTMGVAFATGEVEPAPSDAAATTYTVTINTGNTNTEVTHTYEAYQIFSGSLGNGKLGNIVWGSGVNGDALLTELKKNEAFENCTSAADVAEKLNGLATDAALAQTFADIVSTKLTTASASGSDKIEGLAAGYYLIKDQDDSIDAQDDFYTRFILEVVNNVEVTPKGNYPSVDKTVQDDGGSTWAEASDYKIGESFKFKLEATIPADVNMPAYETYKTIFTDTMSAGVTFESIESVTVGSATLAAADYALAGVSAGDAGKTWTITINDIKEHLSDDEQKAAVTITVIYKAHLNADAQVKNADYEGTDTSNNKVKLTFSNNPNAGGEGDTGDTPEDTVWVFSYKVDNIKVVDTEDGDPLPDAGFTLYSGTTAVKLFWDSSKNAYRPPIGETETAAAVEEMISKADGKFNIIGLDEGTYTLKETTTPPGYTTAADVTVTITATTAETTSSTGEQAKLTLTNSPIPTNKIIDKSGATLPETGGIGTTIFYVAGSILVLAAAILLVTKRRMGSDD